MISKVLKQQKAVESENSNVAGHYLIRNPLSLSFTKNGSQIADAVYDLYSRIAFVSKVGGSALPLLFLFKIPHYRKA